MFDIETLLADTAPVAVLEPPAPAAAPVRVPAVPRSEAAFFCTVTPFYQPIVRAGDLGVVGYEALARGPQGSPLHPARVLFAAAGGLGETERLERVCWTASVLNATRHGLWNRPGELLFLNLSAERVRDPAFLSFAQGVVHEAGIDPARIVVEVTEESRLRTERGFLEALRSYRALGFRIALDDVGAGHADLQVLAEVRPDFLKVALELVRGVDAHGGRRHVIASLVALGRAMGSTVVVEGVETTEELAAVRALGADLVQGHLVARPSAGLLPPQRPAPFAA